MSEPTLRIGQIAERVGVSARTLRYYEEIGLLAPSGEREGGARRYAEDDIARVLRIRELQELMGFDLDEIGSILGAEDRLAELRLEFRAGARPERQEEIVAEAVEINDRLRAQVRVKLEQLGKVLAELEDKAARYREYARQLKAPASKR